MKSYKMSMKHTITAVVCIGAAAMMAAWLPGCKKDNEEEPPPQGLQGTYRYETVPYSSTSATKADGGETYKLVHSAYDKDTYYYLFLLGHVNKVPIAFREAIVYEGRTPITVGYSSTNTTSQSIEKSLTTATENTVSKSQEVNYGVEVSAGVEAGPFSASVTASVGGATGWDNSNTRSVSDTYTTTSQKTEEITNSMEMTIGNFDEPIGKYRFALFGTTDVYLVLHTDKTKKLKDSYIAVCARPGSYAWGIDYEPDLGGSFAKTAPGDMLKIPILDIASLPVPASNDISVIPPPEAPRASLAGGDYTIAENSMKVTLSTNEASQATIYYTTNGSTPTISEKDKYTGPISIPLGKTTLKAIAANSSVTSAVMTEEYTIVRNRQTATKTFDFDIPNAYSIVKAEYGDFEIDSKAGKTTSWDINVDIVANGNNAKATFIYKVYEGGGDRNASVILFKYEMPLQIGANGLRIENPTNGYVNGSFTGQNHNLNNVSYPTNDTPFTGDLKVRVDGSGTKNDDKNCRAVGKIQVKYSFDPS